MRIVVDTIWWSHLTSLLRRLLGISLRKFGLQATTARCRFEIVQQRTNHLPELILGLGIAVVNLEAELVIVLKSSTLVRTYSSLNNIVRIVVSQDLLHLIRQENKLTNHDAACVRISATDALFDDVGTELLLG